MGYDIARFQGDVDEELICPICSGVLEEPLHVSMKIINNFRYRKNAALYYLCDPGLVKSWDVMYDPKIFYFCLYNVFYATSRVEQ